MQHNTLSAAEHGQWAAKYAARYVASKGLCEAYAALAAYHAEAAHKLSRQAPRTVCLCVEPGRDRALVLRILDRLP
jgi:hypothetical protein